MKKKIFFLLVVIFLAAGVIYKRPVTLAQICPEVPLGSCTGITAYYSVDTNGEERSWEPILFPSGSEPFDRLMEQLQQQQFRKSLKTFLPSGTKSHLFSEGDFTWELALEFADPIPIKDGSTAGGTLIRVSDFYDDLTIDNSSGDQKIRCHAADQQQWSEGILHILSGEA